LAEDSQVEYRIALMTTRTGWTPNAARRRSRKPVRSIRVSGQQDLNPGHLAGQNIGPPADELGLSHVTAFHLRKRGRPVGGLDDEELKQVPLVPVGSRLQQGATYVNLAGDSWQEFTATAEITASSGDAYAPKDQVPYEIWNRLIGEAKPGQE
jgi:hypothetical protein